MSEDVELLREGLRKMSIKHFWWHYFFLFERVGGFKKYETYFLEEAYRRTGALNEDELKRKLMKYRKKFGPSVP